ncbi:hypothetical protein GCM10022402_42240 [Salinactinospora qingdaonensis]|uniref:Uncharacterized protein n=1 Tax=Salinactinospora qingdaonensis TaxID=702744 RepID=A0ABP7GBA5_9ACTN
MGAVGVFFRSLVPRSLRDLGSLWAAVEALARFAHRLPSPPHTGIDGHTPAGRVTNLPEHHT